MILIAHRGNYKGRDKARENTWQYIKEALWAGLDVEIDVWYKDYKFYLGHDCPTEEVDFSLLKNKKVWVHAKNIDALHELWHDPDVHVFWHDRDEFTYTNKGIKWAYSGVITYDGVMVMPDSNLDLCYKIRSKQITPFGVCTDNIALFNT